MHHLMSLRSCEYTYDKKYIQTYLVDIGSSSNSFFSTIILRRTPKFILRTSMHTYISPTLHDFDQWPKVHSMHLGLKISGVDLPFLSTCRCGYSLNHTLCRTGVINCMSRRTFLLIFTPQMYASPQPWRIPEELLA